MKLALIPPLSRLDDINITSYQLALPHLVNSLDPLYRNAYVDASKRGDYVILDNGAADGGLWGWNSLLTVADMIQASEVVLPDVIGDAEKTWKFTSAIWLDREVDRKYMYVVHGNSVDEVTIQALKAIDLGVHTIGIPRHLVTTIRFDARIRVVDALRCSLRPPRTEVMGDYDIHFLGTNPHWMQEVKYAEEALPGVVRGVDTSAPYVYGRLGLKITTDEEYSRPEGYFERPYAIDGIGDYATSATSNIRTLRRWCGYKW